MAVLTAGFCVCSVCPSSPALSQMGYNLSPQFTQLLAPATARAPPIPPCSWIASSRSALQLQVLTEAFREKDTAVQGSIRSAS